MTRNPPTQSHGVQDRLRLRYRNELIGVAGEIVCNGLAPTSDVVTDIARKIVPKEHLDDFVRMAIQDLENLHEGNFARLRLRASEYQAWRARYPAQGDEVA